MDRMTAALAGLLHDIGKFWQRADQQSRGPGFEAFDRDDYGQHGAHATWSAAFIQQHLPSAIQDVGAAVLYHHKPQDWLSKVVALADRLASGERAEETEKQPRNLLSIFCQLGDPADQQTAPAYLPLRPLDLDSGIIFPTDRVDDRATAYQELWDQFVLDVSSIQQSDDPASTIETFYHLLHRYTWCVPSAFYRSTPDISLYDHSRVTAAVAACLADQPEEQIDYFLRHIDDDSQPLALLVEGDVSGVQRFIYTLTSKGAAKGLRGRSFYLQLLTEAIARYLLRHMQLPITNLIYVGGGHFYLLIPGTELEHLQQVQRELDGLLLSHHDGDLYVAIGCAELCAADFQADAFSRKWREVGQAVGRSKRRKFGELPISDLASTVFAPRGHGGNEELECQVCHVERDDIRTDEDGTRKCALCASLETLGWALGHTQVLVLTESNILSRPQESRDWRALLAGLGLRVNLLDATGQAVLEADWIDAERATALGFRTLPSPTVAAQIARKTRASVALGTRYTANVTPYKPNGDVATFEDMQECAQGAKQLGVLRMDVDNLGHLLSQGFQRQNGKHLSTLARVASLSSMLTIFFEGWVGTLCQQVNNEAEMGLVYTIYSGGDDLFIVGAWDVLPGLAETIHRDLGAFAAGNPLVHVSGGITLHGGKYPLYQAAQDAARALDEAKDRPGKNALAFLGQTVPWEQWGVVTDYQQELTDLVENGGVGRSLLHVLQRLHASYRATRDELVKGGQLHSRNGRPRVVWGPFMWHSAYLLSRLAERSRQDTQQRIRALRDQLGAEQFQAIEVIGLAARWAEALTKRENIRQED